MKKASITEAKNRFSALVEMVKNGSTVLILDRGRPVARLVPVHELHDDDARLERLTRDGIVRPPKGAFPKDLFTRPLPRAKNGASVLQALLDERREGR